MRVVPWSSLRRIGARYLSALILAIGLGSPALADSTTLLLDVTLNGTKRGVIATFLRDEDGEIGAKLQELSEIGLKMGEADTPDAMVRLRDLPDTTYTYDEERQAIAIEAGMSALATRTIDAKRDESAEPPPPPPKPQRDFGAVLNYTLFAAGSEDLVRGRATYHGGSASLDAKIFTGFGALAQSGIVGDRLQSNGAGALRLDTSWVFSDPDTTTVYRAGDTIGSGLAWTRPIRMGGLQMQRNFALRSDLVTLPLPTIGGSAAVPSSIEVYVNNARTFQKDVAAGPFQIENLPMVSGAGEARLVVRDASGRQVESNVPFFVSGALLKPGLFDYSIEAGFARLDYGAQSFSYDRRPVGSASLRYGVTDWLTLQGHAEGTRGFGMAGIGADVRLLGIGLATLAGSASGGTGAPGFQLYGALQLQFGTFNVQASSQRTFGNYLDLAAVTAPARVSSTLASIAQASGLPALDFGAARPNKAIDRVSISSPLGLDPTSVSLTLAQIVDAQDRATRIASLSLTRNLGHYGSLFASAFVDLKDRSRMGIFAGYSIPLGKEITATATASRDRNGMSLSAQAIKPLGTEAGDYGWRVGEQRGQTSQRAAALAYRTPVNEIEGSLTQGVGGIAGSAQMSGALTLAGRDLFLTPRISDAVAVVDAGAPGVAVSFNNRPAGVTGRSGKLLVSNLRSFEKNRLTIDADALPPDAQAASTHEEVVPADGGVVVVAFGVQRNVSSAIVRIVDAQGKDLPAGLQAVLNEGPETVVGYDGRVFLTNLSASNRLVVRREAGECAGTFERAADTPGQSLMGPVVCVPLSQQ